MRQRLVLPAFFTFLLAALGAHAATVQVEAFNFAFIPAEVNINVGDTVVWTGLNGGHNVAADDESFRSGSGDVFEHTFNSAGTFGYVCEPHEGLGMVGTIIVGGGGGGEQRGALKLAGTAFNVVEGSSVNLQVLRLNGDDGAVSVTYSVSAGTAQAADFTAAVSTLSWADGNDDPKIITVTSKQDAAVEGNETVVVTLSNPTGGASIDNTGKTATVTIQDDDSGGAVPTAPANLQAHAHSTTEVMLTWTDSSGETGYRIERKTLGGAFQEVGTAAANSTSAIVGGLTEATFYTLRIRAENGAGFSSYSNEAGVATNATPGPCNAPGSGLCLNERFRVELFWRAAGGGGPANPVPLAFTPDSGLFFFLDPFNLEMLVKVLDACGINDRYWVFYAATTNVELTLTVIDTQTGRVKVYFNPLNNPAAPVQDTDAFPCS